MASWGEACIAGRSLGWLGGRRLGEGGQAAGRPAGRLWRVQVGEGGGLHCRGGGGVHELEEYLDIRSPGLGEWLAVCKCVENGDGETGTQGQFLGSQLDGCTI